MHFLHTIGRKTTLLLAAASLALATQGTGTLLAASATGGFAVRGLGAQPCRDVRAAMEGEAGEALVQAASAWIAGYVSQHNRLVPDTYESMPINDNTVVARLALGVCRSNPDQLFESIVATLISSFGRAALSEESEMIEVGQDNSGVQLRREVFRRVQLALIEEGVLGPGAADGHYGPRSQAALIAFQKSRGMAETGLPDPSTLIMLFAIGEKVGEDNDTQ